MESVKEEGMRWVMPGTAPMVCQSGEESDHERWTREAREKRPDHWRRMRLSPEG